MPGPAEPPETAANEAIGENPGGHFEEFFAVVDPWNYGSRYEREKYQRQLAMLPEGPVGQALELACAEGHFTVELAPRVRHLLATDISRTALSRTRARCAGHGNIDYAFLDYAAGPIPGDMDLIVCSETLYYLPSEAQLRKVAPAMVAALRPGGCLLVAHAHAVADDMSRTGFDWGTTYGVDVIHRVFAAQPGLALERSLDTELYRIDRFRRLRPGAPAPVPLLETAPVAAPEPGVAKAVLWGGATLLRAQAMAREQRSQVPVLRYDGVSPDAFRAQMRWLRANGYHAINSAQLFERMRSGAPFAGRPVAITFDGGLRDFADHAWPILLAHDFTAEIFIATDQIAQTAIDAPTLARLAAEGAAFGSQIARSPPESMAAEALAGELADARARLAQWLGRPVLSFAAPFSIAGHRLGPIAMQCGYQLGFSGETGPARLNMNRFALPRIEISADQPLDAFVARMETMLNPE